MRWKNLDNLLKQYRPQIRRIYQEIIDNCVDSFTLLGDLDTQLSQKDKRLLNTKLEEAKESPYYEYLSTLSLSIRTKRQFLLFIVTFYFLSKIQSINNIASPIFNKISNESIDLVNKATNNNFDFLPSYKVDELSLVPSLQLPLTDYLFALSIVDAERITRNIQSYAFDSNKEIEKLTNAMISVNGAKRGGVIHDTAISVANLSYIEPIKDYKVIFRAIEDDKTTKMCNSLDGKIFFINKENTFTRYFESLGGDAEITIKGLKTGINLPPISDHIHRCRSWVEIYEGDTNE